MKLSSILFRERNSRSGLAGGLGGSLASSGAGGSGTGSASGDYHPGFCPPKRDRSKSLCVPQAMPLIRVETCKEDASVPTGSASAAVHDLIAMRTKRRTSMAV